MTRAFVVVAALAASGVAHADPLALRTPHLGRGVSAVLGVPSTSAAYHFASGLALSASLQLPLSAAAVDVGYQYLMLGDEAGWSLQTTVWGGATVTLVDVDLALDLGLAVHARLHKSWFVTALGAAVPASFRITRSALTRLPLAADVWLGAELGPLQFGVQLGAGITLLATPSPSLYLQAALYGSLHF